jgi:hypothetical protein
MASRRTYHVTPGPDGAWRVKAEGASRASSTHDKKTDAVQNAKKPAKMQPLDQVVIHGQDGKIQTEHTYRKDLYLPKG